MPQAISQTPTRRNFLQQSACGFGALSLSTILHDQAVNGAKRNKQSDGPLATRSPHIRPRAQRVIFLFMKGGPSQMDLFDYKPELKARSGQAIPYDLPSTEATVGLENTKLLGPVAGFRHAGECGLYMSKLLPQMSAHADKFAVLRGMQCDSLNHPVAVQQLHTGNLFDTVPSMGSWISYGLGTENQRLPSYITILPGEGERNFSSAFLPAIHQGTQIQSVGSNPNQAPIRHLSDTSIPKAIQRRRIDFIQSLNQRQVDRLQSDQTLEGTIESFELAFRMQSETPKLVDFSNEDKSTLQLYGIDEKDTDRFGRQCLLARRFAEAGVRFVQVTLDGWDHHNGIAAGIRTLCHQADKPISALFTDLQRRGLLDDTLVIWGGEFGRTPHAQNGDGREHNPHGFTLLMAGGGVKGGITHGATDDFGYYAVEGDMHINDLHATMLHLLGIDHEQLTYDHHGRPFRLTDVAGKVNHDILI